jgi:serine/threonine-protein kinase
MIGEELFDEPISIRASDVTSTGKFVGTPIYAAPEQLLRLKVDFNSRLFSIGAIFYELLTGKVPHKASNLSTLAQLKLSEKHSSLKDFNPDYSEDIQNLISSLLKVDPIQRVDSAQRAANILQSIAIIQPKIKY